MHYLLVREFMNTHPDWEQILSEPPFCIDIKWKDDYVLLKYDQINSDFKEPIVQECRGIIFKRVHEQLVNQGLSWIDYRPVCVPFWKFFNADEPNGADALNKIIANTKDGLVATEKVDGSLIKVWYDGYSLEGWHVSTNGNIDARDSNLQFQTDTLKTYYDLFLVAKENSGLSFDNLDPQYTYMFELISPYNRVVVRYTDTKLIHISTRNNVTLQEEEQDIGVEKPKVFFTNDVNDIVYYAQELQVKDNTNYEGFVVRDCDYNRVKVKSPRYLEIAYLKGNGVYTTRKIIEIILQGESSEILAYFPEYTEDFNKVGEKLYRYEMQITHDLVNIAMPLLINNADKKTYALAVKNLTNPAIMFNAYNDYYKGIEVNKMTWFEGQIKNIRIESLEQALERI